MLRFISWQTRGNVSLDATIGTYLSDCPYGDRITLKQLLEMKSGLPDYAEEQALRDKYGDAIYSGMDPASLRADIMALTLKETPGEKFEYTNTNYFLLGLIIEKVSGESYENYITAHLLNRSVCVTRDLTGISLRCGLSIRVSRETAESSRTSLRFRPVR